MPKRKRQEATNARLDAFAKGVTWGMHLAGVSRASWLGERKQTLLTTESESNGWTPPSYSSYYVRVEPLLYM